MKKKPISQEQLDNLQMQKFLEERGNRYINWYAEHIVRSADIMETKYALEFVRVAVRGNPRMINTDVINHWMLRNEKSIRECGN